LNGAASRRFALADAVMACKLTPEQYNLAIAIFFTTLFKEQGEKPWSSRM
jgi:hypothetical protein